MIHTSINVPLILTLTRLIVSPILIPLLFSFFLPLNFFIINATLTLIFLLLSLTDFLDGFLARRYNQQTLLGALLDPIADKFLLFSALITLVAVGKIFFYWSILFIGREFFIMGLRHISCMQGFKIPVVYSAKLKTVVQVAYIGVVILNPHRDLMLTHISWNVIEGILLVIALSLSFFSAGVYFRMFLAHSKMTTH